MSLLQYFKGKGPSGFGYGSTAEAVTQGLSLAGKTILVTGCNSGLGQEAMRVFTLRGATVLGTARTFEKAQAACTKMPGKAIPFACELSDPQSVKACVAAVKAGGHRLDAILCNAGIMALPTLQKAHGFELQFFTNHMGHFILVTRLLPLLTESGRVVMLSSAAHRMAPRGGIEFDNLSGERAYGDWKMYGQSKFANLLFAKELARRFQGTGKTANAVHPGVIRTNLGRHMNPVANMLFGLMGPLFLKTVAQGAATEVFAAVHPAMQGVSGEYLADVNVSKARSDAEDPTLGNALWEESEKIAAGVLGK